MLIHIIVSQYKDPLSSGSKKWITTSPLPVFTISRCLINKVAASPYINVGIPGGNDVLEMVPNHRLSRVLPPSFRSEKKGRRKERRRRTTGSFFFPIRYEADTKFYQGSEAWSPWKICPRPWGPAAASWCSDTWCMESSRSSARGNCCRPPANWSATSLSDRSPRRRISRSTTSTVARSIEPGS